MKPLTIIALAAATLALNACGNKQHTAPQLKNVILYTPDPSANAHRRSYAGTVVEDKSVKASFMADGRIARIAVKEGDRVRRGQLIALIDDTDYRIGVAQLTAQYNQMTEEKKRMDEMFARHNVAPNDYEKFTAGYEQLGLQLQAAKNRLDYTRLEAPADGYVAERYVEPGELVGAGTPIVKIADDTRLVATVDLPAETYTRRHLIQSVEATTPASPHPFPLAIESFTPDVDNNLLYHLKLSIPHARAQELVPGMNINVAITFQDADGASLDLPARAVFSRNDSTFVWTFNPADSTLAATHIQVTGPGSDSHVAVKGLDPTRPIVETGVKQLYEGQKVRPVKKSDYNL